MEIANFRKKLFGGFAPKDVAEYIKKLAAERNELLAEKERYAEKIERLEAEYDELSSKYDLLTEQKNDAVRNADEARLRADEEISGAVCQAKAVLDSFEGDLSSSGEDIKDLISCVRECLEKMVSASTKLDEAYANAEKCISDARSKLGEE